MPPRSRYIVVVKGKGRALNLVYIEGRGYRVSVSGPPVDFVTLRHARRVAKQCREQYPTYTFTVEKKG
jgi:hypothetical protein